MANVLKPNLQLSVCNPITTSFWDDPWLLDLPLHYKPTFLNMDLFNNLSFNLIVPNGNLTRMLVWLLSGITLTGITSVIYPLISHPEMIGYGGLTLLKLPMLLLSMII